MPAADFSPSSFSAEDALVAISPLLTTIELRKLNLKVSQDTALEDVAREWLAQHGLA